MRFECQSGCTACCRQKGFVYLSEDDIVRAAAFLNVPPDEFERRYVYRTKNLRRLRTPRNKQCHFLLENGCSIHPAKPVQCATFPFWPEILESTRHWYSTGRYCPGIGAGPLIQIETAHATAQIMRDQHPNFY